MKLMNSSLFLRLFSWPIINLGCGENSVVCEGTQSDCFSIANFEIDFLKFGSTEQNKKTTLMILNKSHRRLQLSVQSDLIRPELFPGVLSFCFSNSFFY